MIHSEIPERDQLISWIFHDNHPHAPFVYGHAWERLLLFEILPVLKPMLLNRKTYLDNMHKDIAKKVTELVQEAIESNSKTSITSIARQVGISRSTLYRLFYKGLIPELSPYIQTK